MMFNATLNNISVLSVLLVDETGVSVKTTDLPQTSDKLIYTRFETGQISSPKSQFSESGAVVVVIVW
jgi:hypothetical protein